MKSLSQVSGAACLLLLSRVGVASAAEDEIFDSLSQISHLKYFNTTDFVRELDLTELRRTVHKLQDEALGDHHAPEDAESADSSDQHQ